ncbi:type I-D CRISPR-associated protein Cas5/Csc1 [Candidatus Desantisbacteria bacterium]|nr:type I-D CRISPR-associated protein Cas5/Csc1 [Candidatus Desantisbacteria bacterium]
MDIYPYTITLIDPLFYSHEALSGAYTQPYIHATAINHAAAWSMGRAREDQSYIISDANGGRNIPRYEHSWIEPDFYFTPAAIKGEINYIVETVKGDMDYFIQPGFGQAKIMGKNIGRNEVLKAYRIFLLPPETVFTGYLHANEDVVEHIPNYIRLGSFRGKAELKIEKQEKIFGIVSDQYVNHLVDPLVSSVKRGVMIGMFPYPIIDNALAGNTYEIRKHGRREFIAIPSRAVTFNKDELLKRLQELKPGLSKAKDVSLTLKDRTYIILHMIRTALSVKLFLAGIHGEERLESELKEIEGFEVIRLASKGENQI